MRFLWFFVLTAVLYVLVGMVGMEFAKLIMPTLSKEETFSLGIMFSSVVLWMLLYKLRYVKFSKGRFDGKKTALITLVGIIANLAMCVIVIFVVEQMNFAEEEDDFLGEAALSSPINVINMTVFAVITEELVFRGALLRMLLCFRRLRVWPAIGISAVLFALFHMDEEMFLGCLLFGLLTGWIFYKTRSVFPTIAIHVTNNLFAAILAYVYGFDSSAEDFLGTGRVLVLSLTGSTALCLGSLYLLCRLLKER